MKVHPHLSFDGRCREAFERYAAALGGRITTMMTWAGSPMAAQADPAMRERILHASLELPGGGELSGGDVPPGAHERPRGVAALLNVEAVDEAERAFAALAEGGTVELPLRETFWAARFGMLVDRWGVPWIINCGKAT